MTSCKTVLSLILLLTSASLALAQGTYTQIDYPGASQTWTTGIDAAGDIVGYYTPQGSGHYLGFLLSGGVYTSIDYLKTPNTLLTGINNAGQIIGYGSHPISGSLMGFVYDVQTHAFTDVRVPAANARPTAINDAGVIVGDFQSGQSWTGFEWTGSGHDRLIDVPGEVSTWVTGIGAANEIVGYFEDIDSSYYNYAFTDGKARQVTIPAKGAFVTGISPAGTALTGFYNPSFGIALGFVYENGVLTTVQFSDLAITTVNGINNAGEVVGSFKDFYGEYHGFTWTPPAAAEKK